LNEGASGDLQQSPIQHFVARAPCQRPAEYGNYGVAGAAGAGVASAGDVG
jgi:hypothetical protein